MAAAAASALLQRERERERKKKRKSMNALNGKFCMAVGRAGGDWWGAADRLKIFRL